MSERWREIEETANRMEKTFEKAKRNMSYSERSQMERDINTLKSEAHDQRRQYVNWLWGH